MTAKELIAKHRISEPPVPVDKIAKSEGLILCSLPATEDISGAIVYKDGHWIIAVNPAHHPNRQRFTIAHELGHYCLDHKLREHVNQDFRVAWRNRDSSKAIDWLEVAANNFAAELLIPEEFLKTDLNKLKQLNKAVIKLLARRYRVSPLAMEIRLANLGIIPEVVQFN